MAEGGDPRAITLKLCQHEETGAIVAALTTSIPEAADSGRNWDYRYCWIRDAYYTVQALNRLGALDVLENYLSYLRNIVDEARGGLIQPLYAVSGEAKIEEWVAEGLAGYRGMGPVRVGQRGLLPSPARRLWPDHPFECAGLFRRAPVPPGNCGRFRRP
jgi:GH15 family glucan-1,4-alpha-glucosidase